MTTTTAEALFLSRDTPVTVRWDDHEFAGRVRADLGAAIRVQLHGYNIRTFPRADVRLRDA